MYENEEFVNFFKIIVLLASFGGLPVPGAEKLLFANNIFKNIFKFISGFGVIILIIRYFDAIFVALYDEKFRFAKYFLLGGMNWVLFTALRTLYMTINRNEWEEIIKQWNTSFRRILFPDIRGMEHEYEKRLVWPFIKWEYVLLAVPVFVWALSPIVTGKHGISSYLPWDHDNSPTFYVTATYNFFYVYFLSFMCSANDSFLMIYTSFVAADLRYLNVSLKKILSGLTVTDNGLVLLDQTEVLNDGRSEVYEKKMKEIKSQLDVWIFHHSELLSFSTRLRRFYSPLILLHYVVLVGSCCTMLFYSALGDLPLTYSFAGIALSMSLGGMLYVMCWFGEKIAIQNEQLSDGILHLNWFLLPKDIQYYLRFIIMRTQRRMELSAYSLLPLNIKSFEKIMKFSYSFYMFIKDSNDKIKVD